MECTIYLTDNCNLRCRYCYQGERKNNGSLKEKTLERALEFIVNNNLPDDRIDLTFLGGEPLLNKSMLYKAIEFIEDRFMEYRPLFRYHITTNGVFMEDKTIAFLKQHDFKTSISIDGDQETHNLNRVSENKQNVYPTIIENMHKMMDMGLEFSVRMTITNNNVYFLDKNITYFREMGVKKLHLGVDHLGDWDELGLNMLDKQYSFLDDYYMEHIINDPDSLIDIYDYKLGVFMAKRKPLYCSAGTKEHIVINCNGEFYPCGFVANDKMWKIGNVEDSLESDKFYKTVRSVVKNKSSCHDCDIAFTCNGARCGFLNYASTGFLNQHRSLNCRIERTLYRHNVQILERLYRIRHPRIMNLLDTIQENNLEIGEVFSEIMERVFIKEEGSV